MPALLVGIFPAEDHADAIEQVTFATRSCQVRGGEPLSGFVHGENRPVGAQDGDVAGNTCRMPGPSAGSCRCLRRSEWTDMMDVSFTL